MQAPILTEEIATRIERALATASQSRIARVRQLDGNPLGVAVRRWGDVTGAMVRQGIWYYPYFNTLAGLGPDDDGVLDEALAWYRESQLHCRVSISPFRSTEPFLRRLARSGLRTAQFMSVLFGTPERDQPPPTPGVTVRRDETPSHDRFVDLWLPGAPDEDRARLAPIARAEFAEWRCYVADCEGQPAGAAGLYLANGVGVLAAGATRPEHRNRGCQTALLRERVADAHAAGCDLVLSQATPGTVSQRNMERVGFRTAYTQSIWIDDP